MNNSYPKYKQGDGIGALWRSITRGRSLNRGAAWGMMILGALLAFEIFNFSSTQFALQDMLGNLEFAGVGWATILAIAFCGIDFAGIARIFTPEQGRDEPKEVWYLFGAWLLAAAFEYWCGDGSGGPARGPFFLKFIFEPDFFAGFRDDSGGCQRFCPVGLATRWRMAVVGFARISFTLFYTILFL